MWFLQLLLYFLSFFQGENIDKNAKLYTCDGDNGVVDLPSF